MIILLGVVLGIIGGVVIIWITESSNLPKYHYWVRTSHKYVDGIIGKRRFGKSHKGITIMTYQCDRCFRIKRKTKPGYHE